jgi:hypothetical protein
MHLRLLLFDLTEDGMLRLSLQQVRPSLDKNALYVCYFQLVNVILTCNRILLQSF